MSKKQAKEVLVIKTRQLASIELKKLFQPSGSIATWQLLDKCYLLRFKKLRFSELIFFQFVIMCLGFFSYNPRHIKGLF